MALPTIFDICEPRGDILDHSRADADFAADLSRVLAGDAPPEYQDAALFFANTYPTHGIRELLSRVSGRLAGKSATAIFRLDTNYGGGKTHALIALSHLAKSGQAIANLSEFVDPGQIAPANAVVAAFDGEIADPANGRALGLNIFARTPWGELAYALGGPEGYERVRQSDEQGIAPGSETLRELIGARPALILLDELGVYLRKAGPESGKQFAAFLGALIKAVDGSKQAALVYTLALGKLESQDAYRGENEKVADAFREALSISARKETLLDPTAEEETARVLQRRLFRRIDAAAAGRVVDEYIRLWNQNREELPQDCQQEQVRESFRLGYPLHPELMDTFTAKTATLGNFQRVRGMLRILGRAVQRLWQERPADVYALQLNQIDLSDGDIRQEVTARLKQDMLLPCLKADVAAAAGDPPSQSELLDQKFYSGMPHYASAAARAIFLHSLAYNDALRGATGERLRYALLSPALQPAFIDDAVGRFQHVSLYLDDRPGVPLRFSSEPNLNMLIAQAESRVEPAAARQLLREETGRIFRGGFFRPVLFPALATEAPDNQERPVLAILSPDSANGGEQTPALAQRIWMPPEGEKPRLNLNNILFLAADARRFETASAAARRRLALQDLEKSPLFAGLAQQQKDELRQRRDQAGVDLAVAIQQAYRHIYYPSRDTGGVALLRHAVIDMPQGGAKPGDGERQIIASLRNVKLRLAGDSPGSADFLVRRTGLKSGKASLAGLWADFHEDPGLPMLESPQVLHSGLKTALAQGSLVYRRGEFIAGPDEPGPASMGTGEDEIIYTLAQARDDQVWPRPAKPQAGAYLPRLASLKSGKGSLSAILHEHLLDKGEKPDRSGLEAELAAGIASGAYVYADGDAIWAQNTPKPQSLSDGAIIYTAAQAASEGVWPRPGGLTLEAGANGVTVGEAFAELEEKMKAAGMREIASLTAEAFLPRDGFGVTRLAAGVPGRKQVALSASWATAAGANFSLELENGSCQEAAEAGQFVQGQMRGAAEQSFSLRLTASFKPPLSDLAPVKTQFCKLSDAALFLVCVGRQ